MPSPHTHTPEQTRILDEVPSSPSSIAIKARAGSSKTYMLQAIAQELKGTGLATSFSASTVQELGKKMPARFPAKTQHALGFAAIRKRNPSIKLDTSKLFKLVKDHTKTLENFDHRDFGPIMNLVSAAKTAGIVPQSAQGLLDDIPSSWELIADDLDITYSPTILNSAREILIQSNALALAPKCPVIDFDDMLYISLLFPHTFPRYGQIISDEVQDLNPLQHLMHERLLRPGGRIIAAGDDRQAIYAFRGALPDSYATLTRRFDMIPYPLTTSFRCPRAGILEAQQYVPDIRASRDAIEGEVHHLNELSIHSIPPVVLCRNNAPPMTLALKLIASGHSAEVAGRDIGKGLISLTKRITKRNLKTPAFLDKLEKWADREIARKPRSKARVLDKKLTLSALASAHKDLAGIQKHLLTLYPDPKSPTYRPASHLLSTIHRAKGREWPEILFLDPQLLPSKWAEGDREVLQEDNLAYVGVTRFQNTLSYCESKNIY